MKLEAKDLRIGNIIHFNDIEEGQVEMHVTWEDLKWASINEKTFNEFNKPIPLTEEWLDRLPKEEFDFVGLGIRVICVKFPAIQYEFSENKIWVYFKDETINIVDYVHEWQNIHHFLTREELQLNQTT